MNAITNLAHCSDHHTRDSLALHDTLEEMRSSQQCLYSLQKKLVLIEKKTSTPRQLVPFFGNTFTAWKCGQHVRPTQRVSVRP